MESLLITTTILSVIALASFLIDVISELSNDENTSIETMYRNSYDYRLDLYLKSPGEFMKRMKLAEVRLNESRVPSYDVPKHYPTLKAGTEFLKVKQVLTEKPNLSVNLSKIFN